MARPACGQAVNAHLRPHAQCHRIVRCCRHVRVRMSCDRLMLALQTWNWVKSLGSGRRTIVSQRTESTDEVQVSVSGADRVTDVRESLLELLENSLEVNWRRG